MAWMSTAGPRATHDVPLMPARASVDHLREKFHDPADDVPPELITTPDPSEAPQVSLADLMAQGGPQLGALRTRLTEASTGLLPAEVLGEVFAALGDEQIGRAHAGTPVNT